MRARYQSSPLSLNFETRKTLHDKMREYQRNEKDLDSVVRNLVDGLNKKQSSFKGVYAYPEEKEQTCNNTRQGAQVQELEHVKSLISNFKAKQNERM